MNSLKGFKQQYGHIPTFKSQEMYSNLIWGQFMHKLKSYSEQQRLDVLLQLITLFEKDKKALHISTLNNSATSQANTNTKAKAKYNFNNAQFGGGFSAGNSSQSGEEWAYFFTLRNDKYSVFRIPNNSLLVTKRSDGTSICQAGDELFTPIMLNATEIEQAGLVEDLDNLFGRMNLKGATITAALIRGNVSMITR